MNINAIETQQEEKMTTKKVEQVDGEIAALKDKVRHWQQELSAKQSYIESQEAERAELSHRALNDGDAAAKAALKDVRQNIIVAGMEIEEIQNELKAAAGKLEQLYHEREAARGEVEDEKNRADEVVAMEEAAVLEKAIVTFVAAAEVHWERVRRIRQHYQARGATQVPFKLANLERRITAVFRNGDINRAFEQSYTDILKGNLASAQKQVRSAPATESVEQEADAAVN